MLYRYFERLGVGIELLQRSLNKKQFLLLSSVLVGLSAGLAAVVLKLFVHFIFEMVTFEKVSIWRFFFLALPCVGLLLTVLVIKKLLKGKLQKGLGQVHYALAKRSGILPKNQMYDQIMTSSITVGFGGSTGLEAPIVVTGAAFGSNYARRYRLNTKERTLLLACGVAGGIASIFNAPIAGVLFALEVLLIDASISSFIPLIIAAVSGILVSKVILNESVLLSFSKTQVFDYINVPFYVLMGVFAGMVSVYHARVFIKTEHLLSKKQWTVWSRAIVAGLFLGIIILVFPSLFGEGYAGIKALAEQQPEKLLEGSVLQEYRYLPYFSLAVVGALIFLKPIATGLTIGGGGNGGNFAPSLFVGAYLGFFFSRLFNVLFKSNLPENNFTLVGMAGILSGVYYAPLTAVFLIAEITGGYELMVPLMIVSSISFAISKYFEPYSMDVKSGVEKGEVLTENRDLNAISAMHLEKLLDKDFPILYPEMMLGQLVQTISNSTKNVFPVINHKKELIGLIWLDDVRKIIFNKSLYTSISVEELMVMPKTVIYINESMAVIMSKFEEREVWILPVQNGPFYEGFIYKNSIYSEYRKKLKATIID